MSTSFVQVEKLHPTPFEVEYFDQYDFYSLTDRYSSGSSRKDSIEAATHGAKTERDSIQEMKNAALSLVTILRFWTQRQRRYGDS
ncbi:Hypothetical predicted protein [Podarcis lilfordi]|uniref:Uncharacterized protein n=1 Tax=Podarcis lilfordi TaxID=74358 RepID=A0AA35L782_9SAUR|nr:Hypothetical predicted protein [Podarcis lilfordi]